MERDPFVYDGMMGGVVLGIVAHRSRPPFLEVWYGRFGHHLPFHAPMGVEARHSLIQLFLPSTQGSIMRPYMEGLEAAKLL